MCAFSELLLERIRALIKPLSPEPTGVSPRLTKLDGIKAVLFDVYGTLFVSGSGDVGISIEEKRADAFGEALSAAGFSGDLAKTSEYGVEIMLEEIDKTHARRRAEGVEYPEVDIREIFKDVLCSLANKGLIQGNVSAESVVRAALEYECMVNSVWPMPDICETLDALRSKGILLGIVSNAQFYTPLIFQALLGGEPKDLGFQEELIAWSFEILESKPSIQLFRKVLGPLEKNYGISPYECLHVGNCMLNDAWTANNAGCRTALFAGDKRSYWPREDDPRCSSIKPDLVITELMQLTDVV